MIRPEYASLSRAELLEKAHALGREYEQKYRGCAQCTLASLEDIFVIDDAVLKAATALSGGYCLTTEGPCGVFSGGLMALGALFGRDRQTLDKLELTRVVGKWGLQLRQRFIDTYGGYLCHEVQKSVFGRSYRILDPEEYQAFDAAGGHTDKCPEVVGRGASWAAEVILEAMEKKGR